MTQEEVRRRFIKYNPGRRRFGMKGYWYKCAHCGKWCGRPGSDRVYIPEKKKMEVDHVVPWSKGGSDELYNLQALCKPCNRSKSASAGVKDSIKACINTICHPIDSFAGIGRRMFRQSRVLKSLGVNKRR